jgi:hypothetical protein
MVSIASRICLIDSRSNKTAVSGIIDFRRGTKGYGSPPASLEVSLMTHEL